VKAASERPTTTPTTVRAARIVRTMSRAASTVGTRLACSHSIGRTVIRARNAAIMNGTISADAAFIPAMMTTMAASVMIALVFVGAASTTRALAVIRSQRA
jgi:hypothetical protein